MKPLMIELFAGLHGWGEAAVQEGYRVVGFDLFDMCAELGFPRVDGCQLVLQDVLTLHGSQFRDAAVIVASPPCQAYSYRAMPWKRAKALPPPSNELFEACFQIQREAIEASGRYIPLIVENVKGAQPWVGRARWHFGSFYLFGDIPALMPIGGKFKQAAGKSIPRLWSERDAAQGGDWWSGTKNNGGSWFGIANNTDSGLLQNPVNGTKGFTKRFEDAPSAQFSSRSQACRRASAQIAKIPEPLARHIAQVFHPRSAGTPGQHKNQNAEATA